MYDYIEYYGVKIHMCSQYDISRLFQSTVRHYKDRVIDIIFEKNEYLSKVSYGSDITYKKVRFHELNQSTTFDYSKTDLMNKNPDVYRFFPKLKDIYWILTLLGYKKNQSFRYKSVTHVLLYKHDTSTIRATFKSLGAYVYTSLKIPVMHDPEEYISFGRHRLPSILPPLMDTFVYEYKDTIHVNDIEIERVLRIDSDSDLEIEPELAIKLEIIKDSDLEIEPELELGIVKPESDIEIESKLEIESDLEIESEQELEIESKQELEIESKQELEIESEQELEIIKESDLEIKSDIEIESEQELEINQDLGQVNPNGDNCESAYEKSKKYINGNRCDVIIRTGIRKGEYCNRICIENISYCGIHYYYNK